MEQERMLIVMSRINRSNMIIIRMVIVRLDMNIITLIVLYFGGTEVRIPTPPTSSAVCTLVVRRAAATRGVAVRWPTASMFNL